MTQPAANPSHVFKIVSETDWTKACAKGAYAGSADDTRDGFIHLSGPSQIAGTLEKHYRGRSGLLLVAFATNALKPHDLRFEVSRGGALFPHLYRPLPTQLALWQRPLELGADGVPVFEKDWLIC